VRECQWARLAKELRGKGRWVDGCYTRTTLLHTDSFVALLLCWPPGVCSPVHAHSDAETKIKSSCFMLVLEGALHETTFAPSQIVGPDAVSAVGGESRVLEAGATAYMDDNVGVHKVGNASTSTRAVSLHIYAPGWQTVQLYDEVAPADEVDAGGASLLLDGWGDF
jgi:cysteine dioxygenase